MDTTKSLHDLIGHRDNVLGIETTGDNTADVTTIDLDGYIRVDTWRYDYEWIAD